MSIIFYVPFLAVYISAIVLVGYPVLLSMQAGLAFGEFTPDGWYLLEWLTIGTMIIFSLILPKRLKAE